MILSITITGNCIVRRWKKGLYMVFIYRTLLRAYDDIQTHLKEEQSPGEGLEGVSSAILLSCFEVQGKALLFAFTGLLLSLLFEDRT